MTPEGVEVPKSLVDEEMQEKIRAMPKEFQPLIPRGPDPKWRYMWRVGPRPSNTRFKVLSSLLPFLFSLVVHFPLDVLFLLCRNSMLSRLSLRGFLNGRIPWILGVSK